MEYTDFLPLVSQSNKKIVVIMIGGLGGLQSGPNLLTELQQAHRPHLNGLMRKSISGLHQFSGPGITPGAVVALKSFLQCIPNRSTSWKKDFGLIAYAITADPAYQKLLADCDFTVNSEAKKSSDIIELACDQISSCDFLLIHFDQIEKHSLKGGYYEKVKAIEELDALLPRITKLNPDVLAVTGDHSCPTALSHISWHPVPLMIHAQNVRFDTVQTFDEIACASGALGIMRTRDIVPLLFAHADRLKPILY